MEAMKADMVQTLFKRRIRFLARGLALAAGLGAPLVPSAVHAACRLEDFAAVAVTMVGMRPTVHVTLDGKDALFLVDTGAFASALSPEAADRYHIRVFQRAAVGVEGIGGAAFARAARVEHVQLGGADFFDRPFLVLPGLGRGVAGVLGQDILGQADAEYDFANGVMRLVRPRGCGGSDILSYWTDQPSTLKTLTGSNGVSAQGEINGQRIRVGLDSGSTYSDMTLKAAARAGVTPSSPDVSPAVATTGVSGRPAPTWSAPFDRFSLGEEAVIHTRLRISQASLGGDDMLLGADFFLAHRIYVSRLQRRLYFTYNGGPVFRLRETPALAWSVKGAPEGDPPKGDPNAPADAAGFARRGAASMARNDLDGAIADFGRAIALQPQIATFYFDRGAAHAIGGAMALAQADFDAGLKLSPDDASALLARASLAIDSGQEGSARADLERAGRTTSEDGLLGLEIAGLYERAGLYAQAIAAYGQWIAGNPRDELLPEALRGRCRSLALAKADLDLALKDCEAAVRARRDDGAILASRSLARVSRGEFDLAVADADAALKTGERPFWALEARGVAELHRGRETEGRADLAAAAKVDSKAVKRAAGLGLETPNTPAFQAGR
jgi:tetratricopeptide (TPR) repeat protein/predicted aspartyl protease